MKVRWTDEAQAHLDSIYQHIAADSPVYALRMVDKLTRRSQQIGDFPLSGRVVPEYEEYTVRDVIEPPYRNYRLAPDDRVDVLAVIHGARLLPDRPSGNDDL